MGETGRTTRPNKKHTASNKSTARSRHRSRLRRRRRGRTRNIRIAAAVLAAAMLLVTIGAAAVQIIGNRKPAEETAPSASTDVRDVPFREAEDASAQTAESQTAATKTRQAPADSTQDATAAEAGSNTVHVEGIDAFALYEYDEATGMRVKTARHESAWTRGEDIVSLEAFAADTEHIVLGAGGGSAWYETWRTYWQQAAGSEHCRIGYTVSFDLKSGEHIEKVLLKPGDELSYRSYLENYLYDDAANADAGWYSHLEPDDLSDTMLLTSIKFTPGEQFEQIDGKITVTGFVYNAPEDFDYDGNYIGDVAFTTEILNR